MTTKMEQQAIVIEDNDMTPEETQSFINLQIMPGSSYFDVQLAIERQSNFEDDSVLVQRLRKNFFYNKKIEPGEEYFSPRKEVNYVEGLDLIDNEIIIYGCDFKKLKQVRKQYETTQSLVINLSNVKLIYQDRASAWKALLKNAKEPNALLSKVESEEESLPKGWFEMKPYTFNNRIINVTARYATENQRNLEQSKEVWNETYRQCAQIYNEQEKRKRQEEACLEAKIREKLEIRKQHNSKKLYNRYEKQADGWEKGKNSNPGAHREGSRSRSRSKGRSSRIANENNDKESNYSFILGKELNNMTELLNDINLKEKSVVNADLSIEIKSNSGAGKGQSYNWNGTIINSQGVTSTGWSYKKYMEEKEAEEEMTQCNKRSAKIEIITID